MKPAKMKPPVVQYGRSSSSWPSIIVVGGLFVIATATAFVIAGNVNFSGGYNFDYKGEKASRKESGPINADTRIIVVDNQFGDVQIVHADSDPNWDWEVSCWATLSEDAKLFTEESAMETSATGERQLWKVVMPESTKDLRGFKSNIVLKIPASVSVEVKNKHGNIFANDVSGDCDFSNGFGKIKLKNLTGDCNIVNRHGETTVDVVNGELDLKSSFGRVQIKNVTEGATIVNKHGDIVAESIAGGAELASSFGNIKAENLAGRVSVYNKHGKVDLRFSDDFNSEVRVENSFGNIDAALPGSLRPRFDLKIKHGDVDNDFDEDDSGEPLIKMEISHGHITIRKTAQ